MTDQLSISFDDRPEGWRVPRSKEDQDADIARLAPYFRRLALERGRSGLTVPEFRVWAGARMLIANDVAGRGLSYLRRLPPAAGCVPLEVPGPFGGAVVVTRRAPRELRASHGNDSTVYLHPDCAGERRAAG